MLSKGTIVQVKGVVWTQYVHDGVDEGAEVYDCPDQRGETEADFRENAKQMLRRPFPEGAPGMVVGKTLRKTGMFRH